MAFSWTDQVASAGQTNFAFSFGYLNQNDIVVFQNGVALNSADWSFLTAQTVQLDVGASENDTIRIQRITPIDEPIVDYQNGSVLTEGDLDADGLQALYRLQELADGLGNTLGLSGTALSTWNALNHRIINLATPTLGSDAATKAYVDSVAGGGGGGGAPLPTMYKNSDATQLVGTGVNQHVTAWSTTIPMGTLENDAVLKVECVAHITKTGAGTGTGDIYVDIDNGNVDWGRISYTVPANGSDTLARLEGTISFRQSTVNAFTLAVGNASAQPSDAVVGTSPAATNGYAVIPDTASNDIVIRCRFFSAEGANFTMTHVSSRMWRL